MAKTIRQSVTFKASPRRVYETLMDSRRHARFTGAPAKIDAKPGGRFTAYGAYISGVTIELVPGKRIVQFWRSRGWPKHYYSTVTYRLEKTNGGTRLTFTQQGVPNDDYTDKKSGWITHYWRPMKAALEKSAR